jgi:large subunit ribosomal protein L28
MPRVCQKTGKRTMVGNNRSHSKRATRRTFKPNIQVTRVWDPVTKAYKKMRLSTSALRTMTKRMAAGKKV